MAGEHGRAVYCLWLLYYFLSVTSAGNVGCLFRNTLCDPDVEYCFNDGAFGKCLQVYGTEEEEEPYRHDLDKAELAALEREMESLFSQGYGWSHDRTQCILQALLFSFQTGTEYQKILCDVGEDNLNDVVQDNEEVQAEIEMEPESDVAYIRYTPSQVEPNPEFADEVYVPPGLPQPQLAEVGDTNEESSLEISRRSQIPFLFSRLYNTPDGFRTGFESKDTGQVEEDQFDDKYDVRRKDSSFEENPFLLNDQLIIEDEGRFGLMRRSASEEPANFPFQQSNTEERPDQELELEDFYLPDDSDNLFEVDQYEPRARPHFNYHPDDPFPMAVDKNVIQTKDDLSQLPEDKRTIKETKSIPAYSEGGTILLPNKGKDRSGYADRSGLSDLLDELDELSFQRSERLDVKKPGPQFSTNNYVFHDTSTNKIPTKQAKAVTVPSIKQEGQKETMPNEMPNHPVRANNWENDKKGMNKNGLFITMEDPDHYAVVDTTFAYIDFKDSIKTWNEGKHIINTVSNLLQAPSSIFVIERMDRNHITFKVLEPNPLGYNASIVAKKIDEIKDSLKREIGVTVTSVGIGDKTKIPTAVKLNGREEHEVYVVLVMVCGVLAALVLSACVLYLTRRHGNKLANLTSSDTEPSKHYQDLCRARMSSKGTEGVAPPQRVTSLSRESDNSPSSRSSTSSWSEEPALSNMDVSTGQMVLSYMEDHLKNKERLDSEWAALCAYQADPCDTTQAQKEENVSKNRYPNALPYDHACVVLNELSNITGSIYINASTITDHDPRNPAYIVTQGPLPATAPDFWQMVWEQGCVVIVMLTRLVENDTSMCHRYWPEEGSELYHIFEVHLVSEHIWCDDYLVRSFYLKNLKTGETRTVTQFHFLSWPESSVPSSTKALLEFRRKVNKSFRGRSCPIVVHCNDGVGRSGTYCLLDMVLNRMAKGAKEIDIAATLEHIRDQRAGSVATKQQFQFVLSAVADEVQAILRVHPQNQ